MEMAQHFCRIPGCGRRFGARRDNGLSTSPREPSPAEARTTPLLHRRGILGEGRERGGEREPSQAQDRKLGGGGVAVVRGARTTGRC